MKNAVVPAVAPFDRLKHSSLSFPFLSCPAQINRAEVRVCVLTDVLGSRLRFAETPPHLLQGKM